jgi:hypothetical protein
VSIIRHPGPSDQLSSPTPQGSKTAAASIVKQREDKVNHLWVSITNLSKTTEVQHVY